MNETERTRSAIERYYEALRSGEVERIPFAPDCRYSGSMLTETLRGADTVREHVGQIEPFIEQLEILRMVVEGAHGAVAVRMTGLTGKPIEGAVFFEIREGQLVSLVNFFDTYPLYKGN